MNFPRSVAGQVASPVCPLIFKRMTDIEERFTDESVIGLSVVWSFSVEPRSERESCLTAQTATKFKVTGVVAAWDAA